MQKLYIHSNFSLVGFGALKKHILTNIADFVILTQLGPIFFTNSGYFITYLATGDKLVTIGDLGCIFKRFISIHTSLWWIFGHWGSIFWQILTISYFWQPSGQFLTNFLYFFNYLATGDKLGTTGDLGCKWKSFISIHTSLWWTLGQWRSIFWKILTIL